MDTQSKAFIVLKLNKKEIIEVSLIDYDNFTIISIIKDEESMKTLNDLIDGYNDVKNAKIDHSESEKDSYSDNFGCDRCNEDDYCEKSLEAIKWFIDKRRSLIMRLFRVNDKSIIKIVEISE